MWVLYYSNKLIILLLKKGEQLKKEEQKKDLFWTKDLVGKFYTAERYFMGHIRNISTNPT